MLLHRLDTSATQVKRAQLRKEENLVPQGREGTVRVKVQEVGWEWWSPEAALSRLGDTAASLPCLYTNQ